MCELVRQHADQWTNLKAGQMKEIYELVLGYIEMRKELLLKIIKEVQEDQKQELRIVQEREIKEMKAQQTKASIESSRSVMNDPKLRNKAEWDRRIRELNDYNTKRFIDQRKFQVQKHEKQSQELNKRHAQEEQDVINAMKKMCELVRQHADQWTNLKAGQMKEIYELVLGYIEMRKELLLKVINEVQEDQKQELRIVQEREIKEMKAQQTKASIESSRSVMNDPKLRNKAERDRRIRELNDYNTKRFIDQRKFQAQKHEEQSQELNKRHAQEEQDVINAMKKERDEFIRKYGEDLLAVKRSTVI